MIFLFQSQSSFESLMSLCSVADRSENPRQKQTSPKRPAEDVHKMQHCSKQTIAFSQSIGKIKLNNIHCACGTLSVSNKCSPSDLINDSEISVINNREVKPGNSASTSVVNQEMYNGAIRFRHTVRQNY